MASNFRGSFNLSGLNDQTTFGSMIMPQIANTPYEYEEDNNEVKKFVIDYPNYRGRIDYNETTQSYS